LLRPAGGAGVIASLFAMLFEPGTWDPNTRHRRLTGGGSARAALVAHRSAFALLRPAGGAGVFASLFAMLFEPGTWVSSGYLTNK
jgi:uncharacterized membrane protein YjjP (DUF1212 family)